ncbi:hepatitis A virus cellular receptor 1 homolog isoform X2 [Engraulis encrasicolus]|uniref:hepatitis A virus cellular receptor 1 homolog isoform X2 n=1 Tax=Engraulis encrasicolus TaxID=184585 RepID=UPI002FD0A572
MSCLFLTCCVLLLFFFEVHCLRTVIGVVGQTVTLPCKYNARSHSITTTSVCWGRGEVPWSKCSQTVLATDDDGSIMYAESDRFQLRGKQANGDVSLSIGRLHEHDSGIYGCRVELPGFFNDLKINVHLIVIKDSESHILTTTPGTVQSPAPFDEHWPTGVDYDEPVVDSVISKESTLIFRPETIARTAVVALMTVATPALLYGLTKLLKKRKLQEETA